MKIGLVCPYNVSSNGGVKEIVRDLRTGLKLRGHDVRILTPQPRDVSNVDMTDTIFLGNGADFKSPMKTTPTFSVSVDTDSIDHVLEQEQFDVLHFHEPWVPVLSRQILTRSKAVNIATFHAAIPETIMSRTIVRVVTPYTVPILKYLHEYTAVSESAASYIRSLTDDPVQIIPNGIDLQRYTWKDRSPANTKTVLFVGRLEARKGVKWLLRAFKLLEMSDASVCLKIVGNGPDREKLELLAEDLDLKKVEFLGFVSEAEKMQLLQSCDLFVSPALYGESFGLVLLEAMASGALVVAGNNSGYEDVMADIGQLSIINPRDDAEFARRMSVMLNEAKVQKLWRDWAKKYVKEFNYPKIIDAYEKLYVDSLSKHRS
jgi:phosphatidyl-myo-inositol alpha-mannosyltransferase